MTLEQFNEMAFALWLVVGELALILMVLCMIESSASEIVRRLRGKP